MLKETNCKQFGNGSVYALETEDGLVIETTDTFLPFYTKNAVGSKQNFLDDRNPTDRSERWMVGVSVMSGCPCRCRFCATGQMPKWAPLTADEIVEQVDFVLQKNPNFDPQKSKEFKINYTRMGEPFLNIENVKKAIHCLDIRFSGKVHHYVSTIGVAGSDFSWIKKNVTLQLSLHSTNQKRRNWLIPWKEKLTIKELGQIRTQSDLLTTLNLTLVNEEDFCISELTQNFDPKSFFIKLSPINRNTISDKNELGSGYIKARNLL